VIEQILKKRPGTFLYGRVEAVYETGTVQVLVGKEYVLIKTSLALKVGDTVILARNEDRSMFVVQYSHKALPSKGLLLSL
jgi:hypothetical protein